MKKELWRLAAIALFAFSQTCLVMAQAAPSLKEILEKNVLASGGRENIARIKSFSFKANQSRYIISPPDQILKVETGKGPVIAEVVLATRDRVRRNLLNTVSEVTGPQQAVYQGLTRLSSGLFTLANFEKNLKFLGLKRFGQIDYYHLSETTGNVTTDFFLDPETCVLKRAVFRGFSQAGEKFESSYEFGPLADMDGTRIPTSWFGAQVGASGVLSEFSEMTANPLLEKDVFFKLEVRAGNVEAADGYLKGNVIDLDIRPGIAYVISNWTHRDAEKAGFKNYDRLTFSVEGVEEEVVFVSSPEAAGREIPQNVSVMFISPAMSSASYAVVFRSENRAAITPKLKPLIAIQVKKK